MSHVRNNTLTALDGVRVGHATHVDALTGCTAVVFDRPLSAAVKAYGGGAGGFNLEGLRGGHTNYGIGGIFVSGGSSTGLLTGAGLMEAMRADGVGATSGPDGTIVNPSVSGAAIYDLGMEVAPFSADYGREAYANATAEPIASGNVGAGTGASVGKYRWLDMGASNPAMKGGVGNARVDIASGNPGGGITVCAMSVVNAVGNVVLPNGQILAGNRDENGGFSSYEELAEFLTRADAGSSEHNTTITVVGINVDLGSLEHYEKVAHFAAHGQVRAINPVHTAGDGDTVFVFSTARVTDPLNSTAQYFKESATDIHLQVDLIGHAAAKAVQESIYDACRSARTVLVKGAYGGIVPSAADYPVR
ncbi:P1 family peptidase [Demequina aurantiaca]|uniref:P1 family peptidase n=1 Tax=Demequina aurantiaca TaxID=676200 RepID=UPI0007828608|nr:P1 family peptidase [Demequina aurantiaca]